MNNEEKILLLLEQMAVRQDRTESLLETLTSDMSAVKAEQRKTNDRLGKIESDITELKVGQSKLVAKVDRIEAGLADVKSDTEAIFEQTADLTEFQTSITKSFMKSAP